MVQMVPMRIPALMRPCIRRIGQTRNVHVIKLLTKGTIEEKIYRLQQKKQRLAEAVIEKQEDLIGKLTKQELIEIFS